MAARKHTDEEILRAVEIHGSAYSAAKALGVAHSPLAARIRKLRAGGFVGNHDEKGRPLPQWKLKEKQFIELSLDEGRVLVASDLHVWPGERTTALRALLLSARHMKPDVLVLNGDVFDGVTTSRWGANEWNRVPSTQEEIRAVTEYLGELRAEAKKAGVKHCIITLGNHDQRFVRTLAAHAAGFEGLPGFDIRDYFVGWDVCYRVTVNPEGDGMTDILHDWAGGIHAAYNNTLRSGVNYVTGHTHRLMDRPFRDRRGRRFGIETGTCVELNGPQTYYAAGRPADSQSGFVLLTYHQGKLLRPEYVDVLEEGKISFRGQIVEV